MSPKIKFKFPRKGKDVGWSVGKQSPDTSPDLQNVRPYDQLDNRNRGGQRPGLDKLFTTQIAGANRVDYIVEVQPGISVGGCGGGAGTADDPYVICTLSQLQLMEDNLSWYYLLNSNIDASGVSTWNSGAGFDPVGTAGSPFTGNFDGAGYTISNLFINRTGRSGLFGVIDTALEIKDVTLSGVDYHGDYVASGDSIGGLIGYCDGAGVIKNCYADGIVHLSGTNLRAGGLIGYCVSAVLITSCHSAVNISGEANYVGGFIGHTEDARISACYATGNLSLSSTSFVGGFIADADHAKCLIDTCYATGYLSGYGPNWGGFAGRIGSSASVFDCYCSGDVAEGGVGGVGDEIGGFVGSVGGTATKISRCYSKGYVSAGDDWVGGFIGNCAGGTITDCYAWGNANGDDRIGGFVGRLTTATTLILKSYSIGAPTGNTNVGGFCGNNQYPTGTISAECFFDFEAAGISTTDGGTAISTATAMAQATYTTWDFTNVWDINEGTSYPFLR